MFSLRIKNQIVEYAEWHWKHIPDDFYPPFHFSIRLKRKEFFFIFFLEKPVKVWKLSKENLRLTIGVLVLEVHILEMELDGETLSITSITSTPPE